MREATGDLFTYADADAIVIPTNMQTRWHAGREWAVMGAGVARLASDRYRMLQPQLAARMKRDGRRHIYVMDAGDDGRLVICLPTKDDWREPSDTALMRDMLDELVALTRAMGWKSVALPRIGCGLGGLSWEHTVRPMLALYLDARFVVVTPATSSAGGE